MIESYIQSWELLKHCVEFLREKDMTWKKGMEERQTERIRRERVEKVKQLSRAAKKKAVEKR